MFIGSMNMWIKSRILLIISLVWLAKGNAENVSSYAKQMHEPFCNDTVIKQLDKCWDTLPEVKFQGIPSDPEKIENACSVFASGMECVDNWSKTCLSPQAHEKLVSSVVGALQLYKLLCSDLKFRSEYLQHRNCYKRMSPIWDDCNTRFLDILERVDHTKNEIALSCIRWQYIQCVENVAQILCSNNATIFISTINDHLLQTTMSSYHLSKCVKVDRKRCTVNARTSNAEFAMIHPWLYNATFTNAAGWVLYFFMIHYFIILF